MNIRNLLFLAIFLILAVWFIPNTVNASVGDEFTIDGNKYTVLTEETENYTVTFSRYDLSNSPVNLKIPSTVENDGIIYTVTTIGEYAFQFCTTLISVEIPDTVTTIEKQAFHYCTSLKNIKIPNSVTTIGAAAIGTCTSLESVEIPDSVKTIGQSAFSYCKSLKSITIPSSITSIEYFTFGECISLKSVEIPNSVKIIGTSAFHTCTSLESIKIPSSVTTIGEYAFYNGTSLTNVGIPTSVTSIGENAFGKCDLLSIYGCTGSTVETYAITNNINFKVAYDVTNSLTNITSNGNSYAHSDLGEYTATLTADFGYKLPDTIIILVDGNPLTMNIDYTYNSGLIKIEDTSITGNIEIKAEAIKIPEYTVTINPVEGAIITPNGVLEGALEGSNLEIEIKAEEGYKITAVKVNGVLQILPLMDDIIILNNIKEDMNVEVETKKELKKVSFIGDTANQEFTKEIDKTLIFILDTGINTSFITDSDRIFGKVFVDDVELNKTEGDYVWEFLEGIYPSIKLSEKYLNTLNLGEHNIKFILDDGREIETTFTVVKNEDTENEENNISDNDTNGNSPQTGDNITLYVGLLLISIIGIFTTLKFTRNTKR